MDNFRPDFTNSLVHLTREKTDLEADEWVKHPAFESLKNILAEGKINGGTGYIKGPNKAVCFSEIPLSSMKLFARPEPEEARYRFYGICISKMAAFECGTRPVIYLPDNEGDWIPSDEKWRHVRFEYGVVDFTFEREWRKKGDIDLRKVPGFYVINWNPIETEQLKKIIHEDIKDKVLGYLPMAHLIQMF
ncbi:hypothetical protein QUF90_23620 [Desulfococcaceae bacterium HSG9]|nr:hypothetical protein [Desulfococcaceae bacterium HSG9]